MYALDGIDVLVEGAILVVDDDDLGAIRGLVGVYGVDRLRTIVGVLDELGAATRVEGCVRVDRFSVPMRVLVDGSKVPGLDGGVDGAIRVEEGVVVVLERTRVGSCRIGCAFE